MAAVTLKGVFKRFGPNAVVHDVNLEIPDKELASKFSVIKNANSFDELFMDVSSLSILEKSNTRSLLASSPCSLYIYTPIHPMLSSDTVQHRITPKNNLFAVKISPELL